MLQPAKRLDSLTRVCVRVALCAVCKKLALTPVAVENVARRPVPKSHVFVLPVVDPNKPKKAKIGGDSIFCMVYESKNAGMTFSETTLCN